MYVVGFEIFVRAGAFIYGIHTNRTRAFFSVIILNFAALAKSRVVYIKSFSATNTLRHGNVIKDIL